MNKRHYEHTLPNIRGSLSNTYFENYQFSTLRRSANAMLYIKAIGFSTYAVIVL